MMRSRAVSAQKEQMNKNTNTKSRLGILIGVCMMLLLAQANIQNTQANTTGSGLHYLPIIIKSPAVIQRGLNPNNAFGIELGDAYANQIQSVKNSGMNWIRNNYYEFYWPDIQPNENTYNWNASSVKSAEAYINSALSLGLKPIVIVRGTPSWAQKNPGSSCGPIRPDKYGSFAQFMNVLVGRYSNVTYWEIWNEPDIAVKNAAFGSADGVYGCWGDPNQTYYGGEAYAEMLKYVYPSIKAANGNAQVVMAGLVLDCDPRVAPHDNCKAANITATRFFEGMLRNDGANYFDIANFHSYDYAQDVNAPKYDNGNWLSSWNNTGTVTAAKADFMRQLLTQYGHPNKPIFATEAALICYSCDTLYPSLVPNFETPKAYYLAQVNAEAMAHGVSAVIWYTAQGWYPNSTGVYYDKSSQAKPIYNAMAASAFNIGGASYAGEVTEYAGVRGFKFNHANSQVWILWSKDGNTHDITLPAESFRTVDVYNNPMSSGSSYNIGYMPIYVEMAR